MVRLVRVPKRFFDDHHDRDLDTPVVVRETDKHYWIAAEDPAFDELLSDAEHYAEGGVDVGPEYLGLISSARATMKAMRG